VAGQVVRAPSRVAVMMVGMMVVMVGMMVVMVGMMVVMAVGSSALRAPLRW